jgi:hypothetical protein
MFEGKNLLKSVTIACAVLVITFLVPYASSDEKPEKAEGKSLDYMLDNDTTPDIKQEYITKFDSAKPSDGEALSNELPDIFKYPELLSDTAPLKID